MSPMQNKTSFRTLSALVMVLALCAFGSMRAEDAKPAADGDKPAPPAPPAPATTDDANANDKGAKKVPDPAVVIEYSGKLVAMTKDEIDKLGDPLVICKFEIGESNYYVRSFNDGIKAQIVEMIGHEATLKGKITNEGKYLMVLNIIKSGPENAFVGRRGGL